MQIKFKKLHEDAMIPTYANRGDAGLDIYALKDEVVYPESRIAIATGIAMAIPEGYVGLVHPRSGMAINHGITVLNAPGTVDSGYRGEIRVILVNHDKWATYHVKKGDKIAQLVIQKYEYTELVEVEDLSESDRGTGGFGSTGK